METSSHGVGGTGFKATEIGLDSIFTAIGWVTTGNKETSPDSLLRK